MEKRTFENEKAILYAFEDKVRAYIMHYEIVRKSLDELLKKDEDAQVFYRENIIAYEAVLEDMARRIDQEINKIRLTSGWDALYADILATKADIMATKEEEGNDIETLRDRQGD